MGVPHSSWLHNLVYAVNIQHRKMNTGSIVHICVPETILLNMMLAEVRNVTEDDATDPEKSICKYYNYTVGLVKFRAECSKKQSMTVTEHATFCSKVYQAYYIVHVAMSLYNIKYYCLTTSGPSELVATSPETATLLVGTTGR